jgi:creatinine deaminase
VDEFMQAALEEAERGLAEGGIPFGSVLVIDGKIVGRGHNRRVQKTSTVLHAEMDCLEHTGRLTAKEYHRAVLYSTLSPCDMRGRPCSCTKSPESSSVNIPPFWDLRSTCTRGVGRSSSSMMSASGFISARPELWNEDIGEG